MTMKNRKVLIIAIATVVSIIIIALVITFISNETKDIDVSSLPIEYSESIYVFDVSVPENVVGGADYVFAGKVVDNPTYEHDGIEMKTVYKVQVLSNIKNKLKEDSPIEVYKYGGPRKDNSAFDLMEGDIILKKNGVYIFTAITTEKGMIDASGLNATVVIGENGDNSLENIDVLKETDVYKRYQEALLKQKRLLSFPENLTAIYDDTK